MTARTVVLVGSLDTKGAEYAFARERLLALGVQVVVVDTGVLGEPAFAGDVPRTAVARAAGVDLGDLRAVGDRAGALTAMARGARRIVVEMYKGGRLHGALALGGSGTTGVAATAFRGLPFGVPKLILSTMTAANNTRDFVGHSDLVLAASVVDIAGLNHISRTVIANAAAAVVGMVDAPPLPTAPGGDRPVIAASMIGLTTRAVTAGRERLEDLRYEVLVFHMTGGGGLAMESLIESGLVAGVLDLTTSELADELGGGICSAGPDRLRAAARLGVPQVVAPGGLDMINFGPRDTVPDRFADRVQHVHNAAVTLVRTSGEESAELGRRLVERLAAPAEPAANTGSAVLLLPTGGLSAIDVEGHPFHDAVADAALAAAVHAAPDPARVRLETVPGNLDEPAFGRRAADELHALVAARVLQTAWKRPGAAATR